MNKKQLVDEILKVKKVDTKANLMKKPNKELEEILTGLNNPTIDLDVNNTIDSGELDKIQKLLDEKLEELKEQARKEIEQEKSLEKEDSDSIIPRRKRDIDRFEPIPVMSVSMGTLIYVSKKSGSEWEWGQYGDIEYIEFNELQSMRTGQRRFIDEPFIIILDEDVVYHMGLDKMYAKFDKNQVESLDYIFKLNQSDFIKTVDALPKGIQHSLVMRARKLCSKGTLDSLKKINHINEKFGTDIQRG